MSTRDLVHIALFAAVTAAAGLFPPFPLPVTGVPITVQSIGPMLAGSILGARKGFLSQLLFLVLVAAGLPLLAGGRGGLAVFVGPTAGFLVGWLCGALVVGALFDRLRDHTSLARALAINAVGGILVVYGFGLVGMLSILNLSFKTALLGLLPFIPGDLIKVAIASFLAVSVHRVYPIRSERQPSGVAG